MQTRFKDGSVIVCGGCSRDGELQYVGERNSRLCKMGLAIGKRADPATGEAETIWCNVTAWHDAASVLARARKGNQVLAVGYLKTHEYEGKQYTELVADFVSVCAPTAVPASMSAPGNEIGAPSFEELDDGDDNLPF